MNVWASVSLVSQMKEAPAVFSALVFASRAASVAFSGVEEHRREMFR
jgi:hypothetical protein